MKKHLLLLPIITVLVFGCFGAVQAMGQAGEEQADGPGWIYEDLIGVPVGWRSDGDGLIRALGWGLEQRFRYEVRDGIGFNEAVEDDFLLSRTRVWVNGEIGSLLEFHFEGRDAHAFGDDFLAGDNPAFEDDFDIFQAYIAAKITDQAKVRIGRQMIAFDDHRLVGNFLWSNTSRSFDGIRGIFENDQLALNLGAVQVVRIFPDNRNHRNYNDQFYFLHATAKKTPVEKLKTSVFAYFRDTEFGGGMERNQYTIGTRVWGDVGDLGCFYDFFGAYQFGDVSRPGASDQDISAFALHGEVGHTFQDAPLTPRWSVEGNWASGDHNPGGGTVRTFDQLYPTNHFKYGIADVVGLRNARNVGTHLKVKPTENTNASLSYFAFWVDHTQDSLYNAGGRATVAPASGSNNKFVGHEVDAQFDINLTKNVNVATGIGYFFAEDFVKNNSAFGDDYLFGFVQMMIALK